jgi:hypothetical protein
MVRRLPEGFELDDDPGRVDDAHALYERFGFARPGASAMERLP